MSKYIKQSNGDLVEDQAIETSAGVGDADKLVRTDPTGKLDTSLFPTGIGPDSKILPSFENLAAGDFVNIFDDGGTVKIRKADATTIGRQADGFVLAAVTAPANGEVFFEGVNDQLGGLTIGVQHWLDTTAGLAVSTAPSGSGNVVQKLGKSLSATEIAFEPSQTTELI